jgi:hypothetical protein
MVTPIGAQSVTRSLKMIKRIIVFIAIMFAAAAVCGQTVTPNIGLQIPALNQNNWWIQANYNYTKLDLLLSGNSAIPALTITGNLSVGGVITGNFAGFYPNTAGLVWNTSNSAARNATTSDIAGLLQTATNCNTVGYIYSPQSNSCVTSGSFFANQNPNLVFAGPTSGGPTAPAFRLLVASDIPSLASVYLSLAGGTVTGPIITPTDVLQHPPLNVTNPVFAGGAKGDGTTDDSPAFQATINTACASTGNRSVYVPQPSVGYRLVESLHINATGPSNTCSNVTLYGDAWNLVLTANGYPQLLDEQTAAHWLIDATGASNFTIHDLGITNYISNACYGATMGAILSAETPLQGYHSGDGFNGYNLAIDDGPNNGAAVAISTDVSSIHNSPNIQGCAGPALIYGGSSTLALGTTTVNSAYETGITNGNGLTKKNVSFIKGIIGTGSNPPMQMVGGSESTVADIYVAAGYGSTAPYIIVTNDSAHNWTDIRTEAYGTSAPIDAIHFTGGGSGYIQGDFDTDNIAGSYILSSAVNTAFAGITINATTDVSGANTSWLNFGTGSSFDNSHAILTSPSTNTMVIGTPPALGAGSTIDFGFGGGTAQTFETLQKSIAAPYYQGDYVLVAPSVSYSAPYPYMFHSNGYGIAPFSCAMTTATCIPATASLITYYWPGSASGATYMQRDQAGVTNIGSFLNVTEHKCPDNHCLPIYDDDTQWPTGSERVHFSGFIETASTLICYYDGTNYHNCPSVSGYAPLASPAFTGTPTAPTAANGTNTTQIATTAFVLANMGSAHGTVSFSTGGLPSGSTTDFFGTTLMTQTVTLNNFIAVANNMGGCGSIAVQLEDYGTSLPTSSTSGTLLSTVTMTTVGSWVSDTTTTTLTSGHYIAVTTSATASCITGGNINGSFSW